MNVLGFVRGAGWDELDAVQYYRTYLPLREVNRHDNGITARVVDEKAIEGATDDELGGADIYQMCRMYHEDCDEFIAEIHRRGGVLVLDSDDDLTENYRLVSGRGDAFKKVLSKVDYVTVSTPALAIEFAQYTQRPPTVLRNHVDVEWMVKLANKSKRLVEGLTIGFSGSPTHWRDWYLPAVPFQRICRDYDHRRSCLGQFHVRTKARADRDRAHGHRFQGLDCGFTGIERIGGIDGTENDVELSHQDRVDGEGHSP